MKTASVRDLRYNFPKVEKLLAQGHEVQITKRKKVIGKLVPEVKAKPPIPDFHARIKEIFGERTLKVSWAEFLAQDRDRF